LTKTWRAGYRIVTLKRVVTGETKERPFIGEQHVSEYISERQDVSDRSLLPFFPSEHGGPGLGTGRIGSGRR